MITTIGFILFLLILSAFFSGSETALTGASRPLMHQLEQADWGHIAWQQFGQYFGLRHGNECSDHPVR